MMPLDQQLMLSSTAGGFAQATASLGSINIQVTNSSRPKMGAGAPQASTSYNSGKHLNGGLDGIFNVQKLSPIFVGAQQNS